MYKRQVPTFGEAGGPPLEATAWQGVVAPARTPKAVVDKLSGAIQAALKSPDVVKQLKLQGMEPMGSSSNDFFDYAHREYENWGVVIRQKNISVD